MTIHRPRTLRGFVAVAAAAAVSVAGVAASTSAHAEQSAETTTSATTATRASGTYTALTSPVRRYDSRSARGVNNPWTANMTATIGRAGGVPSSGVSAVVINLTAVTPSGSGWLTAYPSGTRPNISSLNYAAGVTRANMVTVPVASNGSFRLYTSTRTHVIVDVVGYYNTSTSTNATGSTYYPANPSRLIDTRHSTNPGIMTPGSTFTGYINWNDPNTSVNENTLVRGYALNITAVQPTANGWMTVWDGRSARPSTSTLNYSTGAIIPNMAVVRSAASANSTYPGWTQFSIYNATSASTHMLVDAFGVYLADRGGVRFVPMRPQRVIDSRNGIGTSVPWSGGQTRLVGLSSMTTKSYAAVTNLTAVQPTRGTYLTMWGGESTSTPMPKVSNVNAAPRQVSSNATMTEVMPTNADATRFGVKLFNAAGTTHVLLDVMGRFDYDATLSGRSTGPRTLDVTDSAVQVR